MKKPTKPEGAGRNQMMQSSKSVILLLWMVIFFVMNIAGKENAFANDDLPADVEITIAQFDASDYPNITLYINVTDSEGNHITRLNQGDFVVKEDNDLVEVSDFAGIGEQRPVDVVYVFDTTGSMGDEITGVVQTSIAFAEELESKGRDYRLGLVTFSDKVLNVYNFDDSLTDNVDVFKGWVNELKAEGGDEAPENDYAAIIRAMQMKFRDEAQKIIILITDAPPHHYGDPTDGGQSFDDPQLEYQFVSDMLIEKNVTTYAITPAIDEFKSLASETGGEFYDIAENPDFTGVIEEIGETIANQYRLTYLSPRPTYDGTRRDVTIRIGSADVTTAYHERHLLNVESNCLVGLLCLLPLMAALVIPISIQAILRRTSSVSDAQKMGESQTPESVEQQFVNEEIVPVPAADTAPGFVESETDIIQEVLKCKKCGIELRPGARFCRNCGQPVESTVPPIEISPSTSESILEYCPYCGHKLRLGAKFCNGCGNKL